MTLYELHEELWVGLCLGTQVGVIEGLELTDHAIDGSRAEDAHSLVGSTILTQALSLSDAGGR